MGSSQTKEEDRVIIAQNAAGGENSSHLEQLKVHASATNVILLSIVLMMGVGLIIVIYKTYRRCHKKLVQRQLNEFNLRRYASLLRGRQQKELEERQCNEVKV